MDKNILQFKKSAFVERSAKELVDNSIETLSAIKKNPLLKLKAPKPHKQDSLTNEMDNPDMNI
jgi:hypothetical protein